MIILTIVCLAVVYFNQHCDGQVIQWSRICSYSNDPHYISFDGQRFDYHSSCEHTLSRPCKPSGLCERPDLPLCMRNFEVYGINRPCRPDQANSWKPACTDLIGFRYPDPTGLGGEFIQIELSLGGLVKLKTLNGTTTLTKSSHTIILPGACGSALVTKSIYTAEVIISFYNECGTSIGLISLYNSNYGRAGIKLDSKFAQLTKGKLCGLCGTHNFNTGADDFALDNGTTYPLHYASYFPHQHLEFAAYYTNPLNPPLCDQRSEIATTEDYNPCDPVEADQFCSNALAFEAFETCSGVVDHPQLKLECMNDYCSSKEDACTTLADHAQNCARAGIDVENWRDNVNCAMVCPANSFYVNGIDTLCVASVNECGFPVQPVGFESVFLLCGGNQVAPGFDEGCVCAPDLQLVNNECVPTKDPNDPGVDCGPAPPIPTPSGSTESP